ncbi:MAG: hypothetical protein ABI594_15955, partial [Ginsengibacter sp.]
KINNREAVAYDNFAKLIYLSRGSQKIIVRRTSEEGCQLGTMVSIRFKTEEVIYIDSSSEKIIGKIF